MKSIKSISVILICFMFLSGACSNDNGSGPNSMTGDFQSSASGFADFDGMSSFGVNSWEISMNDNNPQSLSFQLMNLEIMTIGARSFKN